MRPEILYKYRDDSERTEDLIKNKKVWLSSPEQLNDPLECRIGKIPPEWEAETIHMLETAQLLGVGVSSLSKKQLFSLSERETKRWIKHFSKLNHSRKVKAMRKLYSDHGIELSRPENIFKDMRRRISKVGIFSLSEDYSNELMWAHYGDNHKGIALGFNCFGDCKLSNQRHCLSVTYTREKPTFKSGFKAEVQMMPSGSGLTNIQRVSFNDEVFRSTISTKTPAWSYEREWRYIEETHGLFDFPGSLTHIVFGLRVNDERKEYYKELVSQYIDNHVDFYSVVESDNLSGLNVIQI
ncbi:TPA: DUF2971 domain-containing protein [Photobacterium damselae]